MSLKQISTLLFTCLFAASLSAQEIVPGEILLRLKKDVDSQSFFDQLAQNRSLLAYLQPAQTVSSMLRLHLLKYDTDRTDAEELISQLEEMEQVEAVGHNFKFKLRDKTPNDVLYNQQWGLEAIQAPEVWECTTGGTTALGDTIVIANLESCDIFHEDIQGNIWVNHHEIPNNNIDDDGNGYTDDYRGWNTQFENDHHDLGNLHGTQTAGIIGARGDNDLGISGVNWNIKVMIVSNNLQFDQIVASYVYVHDLRKQYNDTNGEKGAFVVATNASFGAEGFPESNPFFVMWCDMYDALGMQGVLNAGATTNSGINIDDLGDMPTSCPSDYLIAVTDIDQSNSLRGGYSEVNVDLGAPGSTSQAISPSNGYSPIGGTSAATPHVSGGIGLLYSLPCEDFAQLALDDPSEAASKMKEYILNGTAPVEELEGKTVTGGILQLRNSMDLMQDDCGSPTGKLDFLQVYPNPVRDLLTVHYQTPDNTRYQIRVYDSIGRLVYFTSVQPEKFEGKQFEIKVNNWASGVYFLSIENTANIVTTRFAVQ